MTRTLFRSGFVSVFNFARGAKQLRLALLAGVCTALATSGCSHAPDIASIEHAFQDREVIKEQARLGTIIVPPFYELSVSLSDRTMGRATTAAGHGEIIQGRAIAVDLLPGWHELTASYYKPDERSSEKHTVKVPPKTFRTYLYAGQVYRLDYETVANKKPGPNALTRFVVREVTDEALIAEIATLRKTASDHLRPAPRIAAKPAGNEAAK
jgi:hypothetical protein